MTRRAIYVAVALSIVSFATAGSPAIAQQYCQSTTAAGTVCAGATAGIQFNTQGSTTTTSPNPSVQPMAASATETATGAGGTTAIASASAGFGEVHLLGKVDLPAQVVSTGFIAGLAFASFTDRVIVGTSNVDATFTSILEGTFRTFQGNATGGNSFGSSSVLMYDETLGGINVLDIENFVGGSPSSNTITRNFNFLAGHSYLLFDKMEADATLGEPPFPFGFPDDHSSVADMSNTGLLFIDASGGNLSFLSGHDYSSDAVGAVPEPSTWAMIILGFMGLGFLAYRRPSPSLHFA